MKHMIKTFLIVAATTVSAIAQTPFTEGVITYKIELSGATPGDPAAAMINNAKILLFIKNEMSRMDMDMGMMKQSAIGNAKTNTAISLMEMMGHKFAIDLENPNAVEKKYDIKYLDDTKVISGYTAKKAVIKDEGETYIVYYTTDITTPYDYSRAGYLKDLKGFPLEYEVTQEGRKVKYTITSIEKKPVDVVIFNIPSEYKKIKKEDLQKEIMNIYSGE